MNLSLIKNNKTEELEQLISSIKIDLIKFNKELVNLPNETSKYSYIPRYNKLYIKIKNNSKFKIDDLLLTIIRTNSKIGDANYDTLPNKTFGLKPNTEGKYELFAFDPFNEEFEEIKIRITTIEDYQKRNKSENWIKKAPEFSKRTDFRLFK